MRRSETESASAWSRWFRVADPSTLYLLRHGEIDRPPVWQFDDAVLTDRGRKQVRALAETWPHAVPDVIYHSPLPRSMETASICAVVWRRPTKPMRELNEWAATEKDVPQETYRILERKCWADLDFRNDAGESLGHATERIRDSLTTIATRHEGRPVLVSGHAILFALFLAQVRGERATEAMKDRIGFGSYAIVEHRSAFLVRRDFSA